jgi:predicted exporter
LTSRAGDPSDPQAATRPGRPLVAVVEGATIQEALERNDALYSRLASLQRERGAEIGVLAFDSLRVALPSLHTQQRSIETLKNLDLAPLRESIAIAGRSAGIQPAYAQRFLDDLASLQQGADEVRPIDYSSIWADAGEPFRQTVERLVTTGADGSFRVATPIFPGASGFAEEQLNALMAGLSGDRPLVRFIGDPMIERELAQRLKFDLALFALLGVAAIYLALLVHFKGARRATLAQAVILVQGLWVIGLMNAVGLRVHFMTLLALPLVVVLTLDNTLHLLQHYMDHRSLDVRLSVATLGRSVVLSCGAIAILYGALALTRDFRDLGLVAVFGAVSSVVGTMMLLPAAIKVWGRGQPLLSVLAAPEPPGGRGG